MAFIPFIGGIKAEMKFLKNGQLVVNVYHFYTEEPIITANLTALAAVLKDAWDGNIKAGAAASISLEEIVITDVENEVGLQVVYTTGLPLTGAGAGDDLPSNVAVVISNKSNVTGRSQRGRTYMSGMQASSITGNTVGSGLQTAYVAYHTEIKTEAALAGFLFGVASYQSNLLPRTSAAFTPFTTFAVENITDSQRRRLPGRGA